MCNLYALSAGPQALAELAAALALGPVRNQLGNLPLAGPVYPDQDAPVIGLARPAKPEAEAGPLLRMARWGMPSPAFALAGKEGDATRPDRGITNIRNTASPHWRRWLAPAYRCLVPFTAFAEHVATPAGARPLWFAPAAGAPLACFAGIATRWTGVRKRAEGEVTLTLFGFLTCAPNADVAPHHPKAMPVILTRPADMQAWLTAPWPEAAALQRPLPDGALIVQGFAQD